MPCGVQNSMTFSASQCVVTPTRTNVTRAHRVFRRPYLTPYQLTQLSHSNHASWNVSKTVLLGAVAYLGGKAVLRSLTKWIFPSKRLPTFALLGAGAFLAYSKDARDALTQALGIKNEYGGIKWGSLLERAKDALLYGGSVAAGALLLVGIQLGNVLGNVLGNDKDDADTTTKSDDNAESDDSTVPAEARMGFEALRVTVIKLMQRGAYQYISNAATADTLLKPAVVKKKLRRPNVLLSVVVWALKACVVLGIGYGLGKVANPYVQEHAKKLSATLSKGAAQIHDSFNQGMKPGTGSKVEPLDAEIKTDAYLSPYLPPLRRTDILNPTNVLLDLVGRELWAVDWDNINGALPMWKTRKRELQRLQEKFMQEKLTLLKNKRKYKRRRIRNSSICL